MSAKDVYRLTFTSSEILSILEAVTVPTVMATCNSDARSLINKLRKKAFEITNGLATPSYVTNGTKSNSIYKLNVSDLGEGNNGNDEFIGTNLGNITPAALSGMGDNNTGTKLGADLDDMSLAQLEALEKQMLAEVAGNGAGADNVISERRKVPRTLEPAITTDDL